ncbi:MAG: hypothetical protein CL843_19495 [Crocinitomicaceae bacterium]|nr:hypothetical protein [Crocinitomicaceae bacterium]
MKPKIHFLIIIAFAISFLFSACSNEEPIKADYEFKAAINANQDVNNYDNVKFESIKDLNLGFFRGDLWIKLSINNPKDESVSYMFLSNDRFIRNYKFYKLDTLDQSLKLLGHVEDTTTEDYRTFNNPNSNLKIDLLPNESAVYLITSSSDGRSKDANFQIKSIKSYSNFINENSLWSIIFYAVIIFLMLVNIYLWSIYKQKLYLYYIFYLASTLFVYLGIEGYLLKLRISQLAIDHLVFVFVKMWALSLVMYTSKFLDIEIVAPRYYKFIKVVLVTIIGGTLIYQFLFFDSSVQYLHFFENLLTILWLLLIVGILLFSAKDRWLSLKYYLTPFGFFILFTVLGIVNVHLQLLDFNSFTFVKIGAIFEFVGFTYFMTALIKRKLNQSEILAQSLKEKEDILEKKVDLVGIFNLIENSLSTEDEWSDFKSKLKELNPNFFDQLLTSHSNLTKSEIRLLTLVKIGYSQKEIASTLNIAPDSVKKARTRVRKKLNLPDSTNLNEYLSSF